MKEIICHEEMYNLAKMKHVSRSFIIDHILDNGFDASVQGYLCAKKNLSQWTEKKTQENVISEDNTSKFEEYIRKFRIKCERFAETGEKIAKIVWGKDNIKHT